MCCIECFIESDCNTVQLLCRAGFRAGYSYSVKNHVEVVASLPHWKFVNCTCDRFIAKFQTTHLPCKCPVRCLAQHICVLNINSEFFFFFYNNKCGLLKHTYSNTHSLCALLTQTEHTHTHVHKHMLAVSENPHYILLLCYIRYCMCYYTMPTTLS